jgi:hypothetical protein
VTASGCDFLKRRQGHCGQLFGRWTAHSAGIGLPERFVNKQLNLAIAHARPSAVCL